MLTKDQEYVVDLVLKGHNVYIGGQAGTGKSYLLTHLFDKLTIAGKKVSVTCTTGIACTHFPQRCHASTIHSWAGMDDGRHESSEIFVIFCKTVCIINKLYIEFYIVMS